MQLACQWSATNKRTNKQHASQAKLGWTSRWLRREECCRALHSRTIKEKKETLRRKQQEAWQQHLKQGDQRKSHSPSRRVHGAKGLCIQVDVSNPRTKTRQRQRKGHEQGARRHGGKRKEQGKVNTVTTNDLRPWQLAGYRWRTLYGSP